MKRSVPPQLLSREQLALCSQSVEQIYIYIIDVMDNPAFEGITPSTSGVLHRKKGNNNKRSVLKVKDQKQHFFILCIYALGFSRVKFNV